MEKVVVYCGTRNVYADMVPALKSLLFHTRVDRVYFLIEDDEFPYKVPEIVKVVNVSGQKYFQKDGPNYNSHWTYMVLLRTAFAKILPNEHQVLSLDNDTLCFTDISELWGYDLTDYYMAGVIEPMKAKQYQYINLGVVMMNLDKFRADKMDSRAIKELNAKAYHFPEQDVLSRFCDGHILELPKKYNVCDGCESRGVAPRIRHYAGEQNWRGEPMVQKWRNTSWAEVERAGRNG